MTAGCNFACYKSNLQRFMFFIFLLPPLQTCFYPLFFSLPFFSFLFAEDLPVLTVKTKIPEKDQV